MTEVFISWNIEIKTKMFFILLNISKYTNVTVYFTFIKLFDNL